MASEMRRAAQALVEPHPQSIRSEYSPAEAAERVRALLESGGLGPGVAGEISAERVLIRTPKGDHFVGTWQATDAGTTLQGEFLPPERTQRLLKAFAISLTLFLAATAWTFLADLETSLKASAALFTLFAVLAFPYVIVGLSSQRSGREAAIARTLKRALELPIR